MEKHMEASLLLGLMQIQMQMKLYHWQTFSHARHRSTDDFVHNFSKLVDQFVETFQGRYGRYKLSNGVDTIRLRNLCDNTQEPERFLHGARSLLEEMQVGDADYDLLNIRDEMLAQVNQLLYLFTLS